MKLRVLIFVSLVPAEKRQAGHSQFSYYASDRLEGQPLATISVSEGITLRYNEYSMQKLNRTYRVLKGETVISKSASVMVWWENNKKIKFRQTHSWGFV